MAKVMVGKVSELGPGKMKQVVVNPTTAVVVANIGGKYYAMDGKCGHKGGPLGNGSLDKNVITCPWHGSKWDVTTGKMVWFGQQLPDRKEYAVSVDGDSIYVEMQA